MGREEGDRRSVSVIVSGKVGGSESFGKLMRLAVRNPSEPIKRAMSQGPHTEGEMFSILWR
jgi:hypothetical protein